MNRPDGDRNAVEVLEGVIPTEATQCPHKEGFGLSPADDEQAR